MNPRRGMLLPALLCLACATAAAIAGKSSSYRENILDLIPFRDSVLDDYARVADKFSQSRTLYFNIYDKASPKRIGKHQVAVPDRFFKVVLIYNRKNPIAMGFLFENKAHHQNLKNYMVKVDQVEEETGLDFFSKVPDEVENRIESIVPEGIAF